MSNNRVELTGNVGRDPEIRTTQNGVKVAMYSLAVRKRNPKDKDKPITNWFNIVAFGDQADDVEKALKKGTYAKVIGSLNTRDYEDKDGKKVYVTEVFQDEVWFQLAKEKKEDTGSTFGDDLPF